MKITRRSHGETALCILGCLTGGSLKVTRLMYASNLTLTKLKFHVERLIDQGLMEENIVTPTTQGYGNVDRRTKYEYHITDKVREVLVRGIHLFWDLGLDLGIKVHGVRKNVN